MMFSLSSPRCYEVIHKWALNYDTLVLILQVHFLQRKRSGEIGPSECGRVSSPCSDGKSSELPTFPLSEFPNVKKVQV